jgi:hypothetical protein
MTIGRHEKERPRVSPPQTTELPRSPPEVERIVTRKRRTMSQWLVRFWVERGEEDVFLGHYTVIAASGPDAIDAAIPLAKDDGLQWTCVGFSKVRVRE